jgi:tRNA pseudouridine38-40 synthase
VAVVAAEEAAADFHARRSAQAKQYIYKIAEKKIADPFLVNYAWLRPEEFYLDALNEASARLIGVHDFSSFRAAGSTPGQPVRTIEIAFWERTNGLLVFTVRGDGFLYRMVRNIVGTLLDVGRGKLTAAHFADVLAARDRRAAGSTAPPQGLYLNKVFYR